MAQRFCLRPRQSRDNFDHARRVEIVEMLREVAYADGNLHDFEANLLRWAVGLLYVTNWKNGEVGKRVMGHRSPDPVGTAK